MSIYLRPSTQILGHLIKTFWLSVMLHASNPSPLETETGGSQVQTQPGQLNDIARPCFKTKQKQKQQQPQKSLGCRSVCRSSAQLPVWKINNNKLILDVSMKVFWIRLSFKSVDFVWTRSPSKYEWDLTDQLKTCFYNIQVF